MKAKLLGVMVAALAVFVIVSPASAVIVDVTYTGTIYSSYDLTGVFGIIDTGGFNNPVLNLTNNYVPNAGGYIGDSYVAHYVFDTTIGTVINTATQNDIYGGADYSNTSPVLSASVTINGHTVAVSGNDNGEIWAQGNGRFYTIAQTYQPHTLDIYLYGFAQSLIPSSIPTSVTVPFTYIVGSAGPNNYSQGEYALIDSLTGRRTEILANIETLTVSSTPLPPTLPLFATGLGALGLLGWRRKRQAALLIREPWKAWS